MSFNEAGVNLHWHPKWEQTYFRHSNPKQDTVRWQASLPVTYRPSKVGLDCGLSWKWTGRPNHSIVARPVRSLILVAMDPAHIDEDRDATTSFYEAHLLSFDGTSRTIPLGAWLYDMELIFRTSHIPDRVQVSLGSRCLFGDAVFGGY
ncbi:hypothetical protein TIFTF001_041980 [Ficus carica]|uniref:Uncharacterized protein n=1 Tax=Ficus carica TaxID=3494 RepID=A0AA87ZG77_FICCA|nr:hypothetical protein TIFTF001_041980 [Ficus carica]